MLATRNHRGVPTYGVLLSASGVVLLSVMSFSDVIAMLNMLYCFGQLIEFAAFLYLRYARPDLPRPYTVPLSTWSMAAMLVPPVVLIFVIIGLSSAYTIAASLLLAALGVVTYFVLGRAKRDKWVPFATIGSLPSHHAYTQI